MQELFQQAVDHGNLHCVNLILASGMKFTPPRINFDDDHVDVVKALHDAQMLDAAQALTYACSRGHVKTVKYLVSVGVRADEGDIRAAWNGLGGVRDQHVEIATFLFKAARATY